MITQATRKSRESVRRALTIALASPIFLTLSSCWGTTKLDLMSTPLVHQQIGPSIYAGTSEEACTPTTELFYATPRPARGSGGSRKYVNGPGGTVHLGQVKIRRGDASMEWDELVARSTSGERPEQIPLRIEGIDELATLGQHEHSEFIDSVNRALEASHSDTLTIFVPGAQSSFYKSCAHATHLKHFMASDGVCITYSWPSTGRFFTYTLDVRYARQATGQLADLIERLSTSCDAKRINFFAYSAGAQLLAPALASLPDRHPGASADELREHYHIGNAYFAAPDISSQDFFTAHLPTFSRFVGRTTFTYNKDDRLLNLSQFILHDSRAGRPTERRAATREIAWLRAATENPSVDAIDLNISPAGRPGDFGAHGAWYLNPWVSSDVNMLMNTDAPARARGLEPKPDGTGWFFPDNYPERLREIGRQVWAPGATRPATMQVALPVSQSPQLEH